ncbi:MAG: N-acetylglucosamine 6-phosphate deacetylase [Ilumatobacteraceae bacterium]
MRAVHEPSELIIDGGTIVADGCTFDGSVEVQGELIRSVAPAADRTSNSATTSDRRVARATVVRTLDATGCLVMPGFIDVQINGAVGVDFSTQPERVGEVAEMLPITGVTSFLPTVVSSSPSETAHAIAVLANGPAGGWRGARSLGVHLEGPFLNPLRRGAHRAEHLRAPSREETRTWATESGVAMVTLAPELVGAISLIRDLVGRGVVVCAVHTAASPSELAAAAGMRGATHLYNAMGPTSAREPGIVGALLAHPSLICGLIVDGIHVDPVMIAVAWRALGPCSPEASRRWTTRSATSSLSRAAPLPRPPSPRPRRPRGCSVVTTSARCVRVRVRTSSSSGMTVASSPQLSVARWSMTRSSVSRCVFLVMSDYD